MASPVAAGAAWRRPVGGRTGRAEYRACVCCCGARQCWRGRQSRWREAARNPRALWRSGAERTLPSRPYERTVSAVMVGPVIPHGGEFGGWPGGDAYVTPPECVPITGFRGCAFCCCTGLSTGLSLAERAHLASNGEADRPCVRRSDADLAQGEVREWCTEGSGHVVDGGWPQGLAYVVESGWWWAAWPPPGRGRAAPAQLVSAFRLQCHVVLAQPRAAGRGSPARQNAFFEPQWSSASRRAQDRQR